MDNNLHNTNNTFSKFNNNGIYLTSANIVENNNNELPHLMTEYNNTGFSAYKKLQLPKIKKTKIKNITNEYFTDNDFTNYHSSFSPENFYNYIDSCNKFIPKMDKILKEGLCPRNIILKTRKYDMEEKKIISDLKKDEMIQRSPGQGIFMRLQNYRTLDRKEPFKLILSDLEPGKIIDKSENEHFKTNGFKDLKKNVSSIKNKTSLRPKIYHLYNEKKKKKLVKRVNRKSSIFEKPLNELIRNVKSPEFLNRKEDESTPNLDIINKMKNRTRDYSVLSALEKCGEKDLQYLIGV